jgi:hypothetical protein
MSQLRTRAAEILPFLPNDRTFRFNELRLGIKGGEISSLRKEGWIERIERNSSAGSLWRVTGQAKMFVSMQERGYPQSRIPLETDRMSQDVCDGD